MVCLHAAGHQGTQPGVYMTATGAARPCVLSGRVAPDIIQAIVLSELQRSKEPSMTGSRWTSCHEGAGRNARASRYLERRDAWTVSFALRPRADQAGAPSRPASRWRATTQPPSLPRTSAQ
jgi:hypothetical protein